jgi:hypothetical protein
VPKYCDKLKEAMERWMDDAGTKEHLEHEYCYPLALLAIQSQDWMRALYYINKDINQINFGLRDQYHHYIVQNSVNNYECREFLGLVTKIGLEDEKQLNKTIFKSMEEWLKRPPNSSYVSLDVLDDIVTSRIMYLDAYLEKLPNFKVE